MSDYCVTCGNMGYTRDSNYTRHACLRCSAPSVDDSIVFDDYSADFRETGYGLVTYEIGSGHDSVRLNVAEVRAVAAHMLAWADRVEGVVK